MVWDVLPPPPAQVMSSYSLWDSYPQKGPLHAPPHPNSDSKNGSLVYSLGACPQISVSNTASWDMASGRPGEGAGDLNTRDCRQGSLPKERRVAETSHQDAPASVRQFCFLLWQNSVPPYQGTLPSPHTRAVTFAFISPPGHRSAENDSERKYRPHPHIPYFLPRGSHSTLPGLDSHTEPVGVGSSTWEREQGGPGSLLVLPFVLKGLS